MLNWESSPERMCATLLSCVLIFATPWAVAQQVALSMGILQPRTLEWVAMPSSRGPSQPRDLTHPSYVIACIGRQVLYH